MTALFITYLKNNKFYDRSMEVELSAILGDYDRAIDPTDQPPAAQPTDPPIGTIRKLHFQLLLTITDTFCLKLPFSVHVVA